MSPATDRASLGWLATALVLCMSPWFSASAVVPQLDLAWDMSDTASAWLTIAVQLGFVVGAVAISAVNLPDLVPPRVLLTVGAAGAAGANLCLLTADGFGLAIVWRALTGAFLSAVYPPALKLVATWFVTGRGTALGLLVGALTMGSALPHLVNGIGGADWRVVIAVTSLLTAAGAAVVAAKVKEGPYPFPRARFAPRQTALVLANRPTRLATAGYLGHMWELYAMWAWFSAFAAAALRERGFSDITAPSVITFMVIGVGAAGCWVGGRLGDRIGKARAAAAMMIASGACALAIGAAYSGPAWVLLIVGLVWGFSVIGDSAQFSAIVTELADQAYVGTAVTLQLALGFILTGVTIWIVPLAANVVGWQWAFVVLAPGPLLGTLAMLALSPTERSIRGMS